MMRVHGPIRPTPGVPATADTARGEKHLFSGKIQAILPSSGRSLGECRLRGIALGRKSWLFAGSERGGERAAFMYTLIVSCKMNNIDPQAWMADVLARMPDITVSRLPELLPWNWKAEQEAVKAA